MIRTYKKLIETTTEASWPMSNIDGNVGSTGFNSVLFQFLSHPIESGNVWDPWQLRIPSDKSLTFVGAPHRQVIQVQKSK